jgi:hypothetical protein
MPESTKSHAAICKCDDGERLSPQALTIELRSAVAKAFPNVDPTTMIAGVADPYVFLTPAAREFDAAKRAKLDRLLRDTLGKHRGVSKIFDAKTLSEKCPLALAKNEDDDFTIMCRGWPPGTPAETGAGDYYVIVGRGSFFDAEYTTGKGTNHGSPYLYDRAVPLIVRTKDKSDAGRIIQEPIDFTAYSEIEASMLGLDPRSPKEIFAAKKR